MSDMTRMKTIHNKNQLTKLISSMLSTATKELKTAYGLKRSIGQGDSLWPILYAIFLDPLLWHITHDFHWSSEIRTGGINRHDGPGHASQIDSSAKRLL